MPTGQMAPHAGHWVKGQSGNPGGYHATKVFRDRLLAAVHVTKGDKAKLDVIAEKLVSMAIGGDINAIAMVADRLDGKVPQPISGDRENPLTVRIVRLTELGMAALPPARPEPVTIDAKPNGNGKDHG